MISKVPVLLNEMKAITYIHVCFKINETRSHMLLGSMGTSNAKCHVSGLFMRTHAVTKLKAIYETICNANKPGYWLNKNKKSINSNIFDLIRHQAWLGLGTWSHESVRKSCLSVIGHRHSGIIIIYKIRLTRNVVLWLFIVFIGFEIGHKVSKWGL